MVATDTASYSDIVFGLFRLLGSRFSPRIADVADQRLWRAELPGAPVADYGPLNATARHRVNLTKIGTHWPDMLRVAGSLVTDRVRAHDLLRMLRRDGRPSPLGQVFAEYGRIAKTLHLLARKLFHGQRGELRQPYREGQEDQLGALGLVVNAVVLWNTRYTDAALSALCAAGWPVAEGDAARLSPLGHAHIYMLGRYAFTPPAGTGLRPLRDPDTDPATDGTAEGSCGPGRATVSRTVGGSGRRPAQGVGQGVQRGLRDPVVRPLPALLAGDQPGFDQLLEVVGHRRLGQPDRVGQIAHARLGVGVRGDQRQQAYPGRVTECLEHPRQPLRRVDGEDPAGDRAAAAAVKRVAEDWIVEEREGRGGCGHEPSLPRALTDVDA